MIYETLSYAIDRDVAVITLNRPSVMNALNTQMRAEITHAMRQAGQAARVVVLTGSGRAFCSGQDLGSEGNFADIDLERTLKDEYVPMLKAITECPVPTIHYRMSSSDHFSGQWSGRRGRGQLGARSGCRDCGAIGLFCAGLHAYRSDSRCGWHLSFAAANGSGQGHGRRAFCR